MGKTVEQLLHEITSAELTEWMAWYTIEPFGEVRADIRTASICAYIAAAAGAKDVTLEKFMLDFESEPHREQNHKEIHRILRHI